MSKEMTMMTRPGQMRRAKPEEGGFSSLTELLALFLPLAAAVGMGFFLIAGLPKEEDARYSRARDDIRALKSLLIFSPHMPNTETGLSYLVDSGQIPFLPKDPWGHPYQYRNPGAEHAWELFSLGPDGVENGDDIIAWNLYGGRAVIPKQ
ncbi:MAG: type II secretion system protein GspG [Zoogloeaceae bacterium]|jgi:general secretion pathway protein G|nr:type II secretion system protein GspG [Zoogloeaceae bacterium]